MTDELETLFGTPHEELENLKKNGLEEKDH